MIRTAAALLLLALSLAAAPARAVTVRDMLDHEVTLAAPPRRIVSLVPNVTEVIYALGAEDRLAGRTDYCEFPAAARAKPSVGGMVNPNLEALVALLVVTARPPSAPPPASGASARDASRCGGR